MNGNYFIQKFFDGHKMVSFVYDDKSKLEGFIALHRGSLQNPAFGATRIVPYASKEDAIKDALRLSKLMSYKAAMAGLSYGGAKGVIILPSGISAIERKALLKAYAQKVNYLGGRFVTGADMGISEADLKVMRSTSDYIVGMSSNPVKFTALGMFSALEIVLEEMYGLKDISGRSFAIQGVGKIGTAFLDLIYNRAGKVVIADIDAGQVAAVKKLYPKVSIVTPAAIYKQKVDVFSPCASGGVLNSKTISRIKAGIILGGANNQLEDAEVGELLFKLGILYAPDYVVNAGGLISVVDEYEHKKFDQARTMKRLNNIKVMLHSILKLSNKQNCATNIVADEMAEKIFNNH